jgi:signal transduction histidine kinase
VAQLQLKNMLVSSVILTLLGMSIVLMVRSSRRAQRLAQQKMEFVAAISHELRTPLAVICSAGENLADGVVPDPARARQYGAVIHSEGRRLAEMVDQALEFAGVQSGRKSYVLRPLGVRDLVQRAINACQAQIHDADVQIDLRVPDNLPLIMADPVELTRALQNLIRNAIKYGGERRWVGIQVQPQVGARGSELSISIHDTGMGIAPEDIAHIFEPFYRSREAVAAQIHGSGLGLSLVRHIVEGHGGRVTVASTPGQGSVFTILLPCLSYDGRQPAVKPA